MDNEPFATLLEAASGTLNPPGTFAVHHLSALCGLVADEAALGAMVRREDSPVYSVATSRVRRAEGEIGFAVTTIQPGLIGREFYMTRGHVHHRDDGEVYVWLSGRGGILLRDGSQTRWVEMPIEGVVSIPPRWAHRAVNVGTAPFSFLAVFPADLEHDYTTVEAAGMGATVLRARQGYEVFAAAGCDLRCA